MRVLITTDWYEPVINGVVTSVMNLSRQLRERGHEVKILTLSRTCLLYRRQRWFMQDQLDLMAFIRRQH